MRAGHDHVRRKDDGVGQDDGPLHGSKASVHAGSCRRISGHPGTKGHARGDSRGRPQSHLPAAWLRFPPTVQVRVRSLLEGRASALGTCTRTSGRLLPLSGGYGGARTVDTDRNPLIRIRNLKVWFPLRKGLLRELVGGKPLWVRAVDGVDLDIRRGEVFCLVGESGCGKTSTGKAILKLVEATDGDILLEMPEEDARTYDEARTRPDDPKSREAFDGVRRKYSVTWKENLPWTAEQILIFVLAFLAATFLAIFVPSLALGVLRHPFASPWP